MQQKRITKETIKQTLADSNLLLSTNKKICENLKVITKMHKDNVKHAAVLVEHFEREAEKDPAVSALYISVSKVSSMNLKDAADSELALTQYLETIDRSEGLIASLTKLSQMSDEEFEAAVLQTEIMFGLGSSPTDMPDFLSLGKKKGSIN